MLRDRRVTCSISPGTYWVKLVWYLANIFSMGRRLNHHWFLGIRCLATTRGTYITLTCAVDGQVIKWMRSVLGLLEVCHFFQLCDRAEGYHLAVES